MIDGMKAEVLSKRDGINGAVLVATPQGEFWIDPRLLRHIRGLERSVEAKERDIGILREELNRLDTLARARQREIADLKDAAP